MRVTLLNMGARSFGAQAKRGEIFELRPISLSIRNKKGLQRYRLETTQATKLVGPHLYP
jgi:hypothetical protein